MILIDDLRNYNSPELGDWSHMVSDLGGADGLAEAEADQDDRPDGYRNGQAFYCKR